MSALYRIQQGLRALASGLRPIEDSSAQSVLGRDLFALYCRMRRSERQHSLRVLRALQARGDTQPDLLAAALLHDVGKIRFPFSIPEKVLVVLVKAALPQVYWRWGQQWQAGSRAFWQRPFAISVQHPAWGADLAAQAGANDLVCALIRDHAGPMPDPPQTEQNRLLAALKAVDDRN